MYGKIKNGGKASCPHHCPKIGNMVVIFEENITQTNYKQVSKNNCWAKLVGTMTSPINSRENDIGNYV